MDGLKIEKIDPLKIPKLLSIKSLLEAKKILKPKDDDKEFMKTLYIDEVLDQDE